VAQGGAACPVGRHGGDVAVGQGTGFVADVPFVFEDAEGRADGRISGRVGEGLADFAGGRGFRAIQDVDDLALAFAERGRGGWFTRHAKFSAPAENLALDEMGVKTFFPRVRSGTHNNNFTFRCMGIVRRRGADTRVCWIETRLISILAGVIRRCEVNFAAALKPNWPAKSGRAERSRPHGLHATPTTKLVATRLVVANAYAYRIHLLTARRVFL